MNVRFKMPKFGKNLRVKGWWKELALTFVATTISIVLTFGTAQYFEHKQKKADARLIAMMVIHDMNNTVETMTKLGNEHIPPKPGMEQKLKEYLVETEAYFKAQGRAREIKEDRPRSYAASIDRTGSKIELKWTETDTDGSEVKLAYYLTKQDNQ